jgi:hypothetical protein
MAREEIRLDQLIGLARTAVTTKRDMFVHWNI